MFGHFVSYLNRLGNIYETRNFSFVVELSSAGRNKQACFCFTRLIRFHVKHNRGLLLLIIYSGVFVAAHAGAGGFDVSVMVELD